MRQDLAAAYLDVSAAKFSADVKAGILPPPVLHNPPRWSRAQLEKTIDAIMEGTDNAAVFTAQLLSRLDSHDRPSQKRQYKPRP